MKLIYNQTFASLFDNRQNLVVVTIVTHLVLGLEQSQTIHNFVPMDIVYFVIV